MAQTKPKVGDPAVIDDVRMTVLEVNPNGKPTIRFADEDAAQRAIRVAAIREAAGGQAEALEREVKAAQARGHEKADAMKNNDGTDAAPEGSDLRKEIIKAETVMAKANETVFKTKLAQDLADVPSGTTLSVNERDVEWVEALGVWTVVGRLRSAQERKRARRGR